MEREPSPRGVAPEPTCVKQVFPPGMAAAKLGLDETMVLLPWVPAAGDLSALSAALKADLGLSDLKKPLATMSPCVELLTKDVKSCRGIDSSSMDTCPSSVHPGLKTVPVCSVGDASGAQMKSYGLAALPPLAITHPHPLQLEQVTHVHQVGEQRLSTQHTVQIKLPEFGPNNLLE